jgi:hypothetical protein
MEADTIHAPLNLSNSEYQFLLEMLEREEAKLLFEIAHTDNRHFREELNRRLDLARELAVHVKQI